MKRNRCLKLPCIESINPMGITSFRSTYFSTDSRMWRMQTLECSRTVCNPWFALTWARKTYWVTLSARCNNSLHLWWLWGSTNWKRQQPAWIRQVSISSHWRCRSKSQNTLMLQIQNRPDKSWTLSTMCVSILASSGIFGRHDFKSWLISSMSLLLVWDLVISRTQFLVPVFHSFAQPNSLLVDEILPWENTSLILRK